MTIHIKLRKATGTDAADLSHLAMRSKAYWGYSSAFMQACRQELCVDQVMINDATSLFIVAEVDTSMVGFYALEAISSPVIELGFLFVEPAKIRCGIGQQLIEHAKQRAKELGAKTLLIQGDPHAKGFYCAMGAKPIGQRESASIPGRFLPLFSIDLVQ
ncbi:MAG: GNAT family N-acetyltransferase [Gammaproteobacteria bacterium]|nr:GNAT family N-acetyltransferase [Gammaproteobacteria bacterium]